jgi:hypothetical protein
MSIRAGRVLSLLEILAFGSASAPALAAAVGCDARTARGLLRRLAAERWVQPADAHAWEPTLRLGALGGHLLERSPLVRAGGPALLALDDATGARCELVIPSYRATMTILRAEAGELLALRTLRPAHATAAGRVLLAHRPAWRASVLEALPDGGAGVVVDTASVAFPVVAGDDVPAALAVNRLEAAPAARRTAAAIGAALARHGGAAVLAQSGAAP